MKLQGLFLVSIRILEAIFIKSITNVKKGGGELCLEKMETALRVQMSIQVNQ